LLAVELKEPELETIANGVGVGDSRLLLRTEGGDADSKTAALEGVTGDVDAGSSTTRELLLIGNTKIAVGVADALPTAIKVERPVVVATLRVELGNRMSNALAEISDCVDWNAMLV
jgi:hypothetical protein